jgi:hypothetical protein
MRDFNSVRCVLKIDADDISKIFEDVDELDELSIEFKLNEEERRSLVDFDLEIFGVCTGEFNCLGRK